MRALCLALLLPLSAAAADLKPASEDELRQLASAARLRAAAFTQNKALSKDDAALSLVRRDLERTGRLAHAGKPPQDPEKKQALLAVDAALAQARLVFQKPGDKDLAAPLIAVADAVDRLLKPVDEQGGGSSESVEHPEPRVDAVSEGRMIGQAGEQLRASFGERFAFGLGRTTVRAGFSGTPASDGVVTRGQGRRLSPDAWGPIPTPLFAPEPDFSALDAKVGAMSQSFKPAVGAVMRTPGGGTMDAAHMMVMQVMTGSSGLMATAKMPVQTKVYEMKAPAASSFMAAPQWDVRGADAWAGARADFAIGGLAGLNLRYTADTKQARAKNISGALTFDKLSLNGGYSTGHDRETYSSGFTINPLPATALDFGVDRTTRHTLTGNQHSTNFFAKPSFSVDDTLFGVKGSVGTSDDKRNEYGVRAFMSSEYPVLNNVISALVGAR